MCSIQIFQIISETESKVLITAINVYKKKIGKLDSQISALSPTDRLLQHQIDQQLIQKYSNKLDKRLDHYCKLTQNNFNIGHQDHKVVLVKRL